VRSRALVGLLIAWACGATGCAPKPSGGDAPTTRTTDGNEVSWPRVEGFERGGVHRFDDPRLGSSVAYHSPSGLVATVYVYDKGLASIPDGASAVARAELAQASDDIAEAKRQGKWKSVDGGTPWEARLGSGPRSIAAGAASFRLGHADGEALSDLLVAGRRGQFVKVRCTDPAERKAACERDLARL
jgi:hypothetical protein